MRNVGLRVAAEPHEGELVRMGEDGQDGSGTQDEDRPIDGLSLLDHLESGGKKAPKRETLIWHFPHYRHAPGPYSIIRKGDYKLIKFWEGIYELYDLRNDLGEANNLAESKPGLVKKLETELVARLKADGAKLPRNNPEYKK